MNNQYMEMRWFWAAIVFVAFTSCTESITVLEVDGEVLAYERFEVGFQVGKVYENPYDPDEITINAVFISPKGDRFLVPSFWYVPHEIDAVNHKLISDQQGFWKVRFTPTLAGEWEFYIESQDKSKEQAVSSSIKFLVKANESADGFIKPDEVNKQYFVYEASNKLFYGFGLNSDVNTFNKSEAADPNNGNWGTGSGYLPPWTGSPSTGLTPENLYKGYSYQINMVNSLGENGGKALRINTDRYYHPLEAKADLKPYDGDIHFEEMGFDLGKYNQAMSFILDEMYEEAEKFGIGIVHTPWDAIADQPYSAGFCYAEKLDEKLIKRKLRYVMARWGYSTSYWMTEYFNELQGGKIDGFWDSIVAWQKALDPYKHPIALTSATFGESGPDAFLENAYTENCYRFKSSPSTNMPACLGEFGEHYILATNDPQTYDPEGNWVRQTFWNALVSKWAGGFTWWTHPIYGEKGCNAYEQIYPAFAKFLENENMHLEGVWDSLSVEGRVNEFEHVKGIANQEKSKAFVYVIRTPPSETKDRKPLMGKFIQLQMNPSYSYKAEWWNAQSGEIEQIMNNLGADGNLLNIPIPGNIGRDACLKVYKM